MDRPSRLVATPRAAVAARAVGYGSPTEASLEEPSSADAPRADRAAPVRSSHRHNTPRATTRRAPRLADPQAALKAKLENRANIARAELSVKLNLHRKETLAAEAERHSADRFAARWISKHQVSAADDEDDDRLPFGFGGDEERRPRGPPPVVNELSILEEKHGIDAASQHAEAEARAAAKQQQQQQQGGAGGPRDHGHRR